MFEEVKRERENDKEYEICFFARYRFKSLIFVRNRGRGPMPTKWAVFYTFKD